MTGSRSLLLLPGVHVERQAVFTHLGERMSPNILPCTHAGPASWHRARHPTAPLAAAVASAGRPPVRRIRMALKIRIFPSPSSFPETEAAHRLHLSIALPQHCIARPVIAAQVVSRRTRILLVARRGCLRLAPIAALAQGRKASTPPDHAVTQMLKRAKSEGPAPWEEESAGPSPDR